MLNKSVTSESLLAKCSRYAFAAKAAGAVMLFFATAWSLLQWALAAGPQYTSAGLPRNFATLEATVCLIIAVYAGAYLVVSGLAWAVTAARLHAIAAGKVGDRPGALKGTPRRLATLD